MIPLSVLDLAPIVEGGTVAQALRNVRDLARHAERLGYRRFWLAEHHNMAGIASAATAVLIAHVAGGTSTIRVGAGGIMLPNHAPIQVVEQFGTLESLFPGRIDLGLGRAPGTDPAAARALRRTLHNNPDEFPQDVLEVLALFREPEAGQAVRAVPGAGLRVPIWILGSSLFGAQVAAALGLPYAFASHFAPTYLMDAIALYRERFRPSERLAQPFVMLGVNVIVADTDADARWLASSGRQAFASLRHGQPIPLPPPSRAWVRDPSSPEEEFDRAFRASMVGSPATVRQQLEAFVGATDADELIVAAHVYDYGARGSYEMLAELWRVPGTPASAGRPM
jgi:luciferase family oxidoreductase group 1